MIIANGGGAGAAAMGLAVKRGTLASLGGVIISPKYWQAAVS
jgi:hypothetical protein